MDSTLRGIIEKFRDYLYDMNGKAIISLEVISSRIGIPKETILRYVSGEEELVEKVLDLRRKITAHSAEEEMHFRVSTFPVDGEMKFPHFQFNEGLHLEGRELLELETFLRKLMSEMAHFFFKVAQENPEMLNKYKQPESFQIQDEKA